MIGLGSKVRDRITGFTGIAIARVEYLTGCIQVGISPPLSAEGKLIPAEYFDICRLEVLDATSMLERANDDVGGPNRDAPTR